MSELIKSYDNAAGRTCEVRYDTARYPRPFWVDARSSMKVCLPRQSASSAAAGGTYRTQEEAEHAAAHFMATGDLPAAAEGSGVPSPKPGIDTRLRETGEPGSATPRFRASETPALQKAREGVDATPRAVSTTPRPKRICNAFATAKRAHCTIPRHPGPRRSRRTFQIVPST